MEWSTFWSAVVGSDSKAHLLFLFSFFCSLNEDVPISIVVKDASIDQVVLAFEFGTFGVGVNEVFVWELPLRVLVQTLHVRMLSIMHVSLWMLARGFMLLAYRRDIVKVEVAFLDTFSVVALWI